MGWENIHLMIRMKEKVESAVLAKKNVFISTSGYIGTQLKHLPGDGMTGPNIFLDLSPHPVIL